MTTSPGVPPFEALRWKVIVRLTIISLSESAFNEQPSVSVAVALVGIC
jgi:hypothetical protein